MRDNPKKNYTVNEVEKLLSDLHTDYAARMLEQKNRIFTLVNQIRRLQQEEERLKERDRTLSLALQSVTERAKSLEERLKSSDGRSDSDDGNRLSALIEKCERYYAAVSEKYPPNSDLQGFEKVTEKLKELAAADSGRTPPKPENNTGFNPQSKIANYIEKEKRREQSGGGFNLEDVLNPKKELNLEELCRELGLM